MRNCVEVVSQIGVHHLARPTVGDAEVNAAKRHLCVQSFAEAVLPGEQIFVEDRSENQQHRHLRDPVADGWNAQRAPRTICLGNPYTQQGRAPVLLGAQLLPQSLQPVFQPPVFDDLEALAVNARRTAIGAAPPVRFMHDIYEFCRGRGAHYPVAFLNGDERLGELQIAVKVVRPDAHSHAAMIRAVAELGGTAKLLAFYKSYSDIRDRLHSQGALPQLGLVSAKVDLA